MEQRLRAVLLQIRDGVTAFKPDSHSNEDLRKFQHTAKAIIHAKKLGYIEKVDAIVTSMRGSRLYQSVFVYGGLTYEGDQALANAIGEALPADEQMAELLSNHPSQKVRDQWHKALQRRDSDPPGSVTAARSFLEATMKWILESKGEPITNNNQELFQRTIKALEIQQDGRPLQRLLDGIDLIIRGVGDMRNKQGDAHGASTSSLPLKASEASLCVNVAGAAAMYFLEELQAPCVQHKMEGK